MKKFLLLLLMVGPMICIGQTLHPRYTLHQLPTTLHPYGRLQFLQFLPPDYVQGTGVKHPLIIFLHGQGEVEKGDNNPYWVDNLNTVGLPKYLNDPTTTMTFVDNKNVTRSFVVLVPQKYSDIDANGFEKQFPQYYVDLMLQYAKDQNLDIDYDRVYLTGLSTGAGLVWDYPAASDAKAMNFAAIVPVSGNPVTGYDQTSGVAGICNLAENKVAIRGYVGADDPPFLASGTQAINYINNTCSAPGKIPAELIKTIPGGHNASFWNTVYNPNFDLVSGTSGLNMYTWMLSNVRAPLVITPVTLAYFKGKNLNDENILTWSTYREVNFDRFEILRSSDGKSFTTIATIKTQEGNDNKKDYTYKDKAPKGESHYQLKQIDKDNSFKLSSVITVANKNQPFVIEKYPNPVTSQLNISIEGNLYGNLDVQVLNANGAVVKKISIKKDQSTWKGFIDVRSLSNGMYMLQIKSSDGRKDVSNFIKN